MSHIPNRAFLQHSVRRLAELEEQLAAGRFRRKAEIPIAIARTATLRRRITRLQWFLIDPTLPGRTVAFASAADEARAIQWLASVGFPIDGPSPISGRLPTPRCVDRSLWVALRFLHRRNIDEAEARRKLIAAHRSDAEWFARLERARAKADLAASVEATP